MEKNEFSTFKEAGRISKLHNYDLIPARCIHDIFLFLNPKDLLNVFCCCKLFHRIGNTTLFWGNYLEIFQGDNFEDVLEEEKRNVHPQEPNFKKMFHDYHIPKEYRCEHENIDHRSSDCLRYHEYFKQDVEDDRYFDELFKILLIGDSQVGKSSLLLRISEDRFQRKFLSTIGVDFKIFSTKFKNRTIKFQIWDTAGQSRFRIIVQSYYKGARGIIVCFSLTDIESLDHVEDWVREARSLGDEGIPILVCGMKSDLERDRKVSKEMVGEVLRRIDISMCLYCECSAAENICVAYPFGRMIEVCRRAYASR